MKKILIIAYLVLFSLSCHHTRKVQRSNQFTKVDSTVTAQHHIAGTDSISATGLKKIEASRKATTHNINITESTKDAIVDGYTITSTFTLDTTAKGDTVRLLSQDDDRTSVAIYYDRRSGKAVAQVTNKTRTVKVPFKKVLISNSATDERLKAIDSTTFARLLRQQSDCTINASLKKEVQIKTTDKQVKSTGVAWYWWVIGAAIIVVVIWFKCGTPLGMAADWVLRLKNKIKGNE